MLLNSSETQVLSHLGWVDKGGLWSFSVQARTERLFPLSSAEYLSLFAGADDYFSVLHHFNDGRIQLTAHHLDSPETVISTLSFICNSIQVTGAKFSAEDISCEFAPSDWTVWNKLKRAYTAFAFGDFRLFLLHLERQTIEVQDFAWYDDSYDKGYQGIIGVTDVPKTKLLIISVQRDSHPVLYDPVSRKVVRKLRLANESFGGNPEFYLRTAKNEFWVSDYDTLVILDATSLEVKGEKRIQGAAKGTMQFMGNFTFNKDESLCVAARPFSGDVIGLNPRNFKEVARTEIGGQPLDVTLLSDGSLFARDWKTGKLLTGQLKKKWFSMF